MGDSRSWEQEKLIEVFGNLDGGSGVVESPLWRLQNKSCFLMSEHIVRVNKVGENGYTSSY